MTKCYWLRTGDAEEFEHIVSFIWNHYRIDGAQSKQDGAKSSSRAFTHILGGAACAQKISNVGACVTMCKYGDNQHADFKIAQKFLDKEMIAKERLQQSKLFCIQ